MCPNEFGDESPQEYVRASCKSLHGVRCDTKFRANSPSEVVAMANDHGAHAHGFTPVYYSSAKLDAMLASVTGQMG